jgi:heme-degrading monooxygenase HmoA
MTVREPSPITHRPHYVIVFRSRLRPGIEEEYDVRAEEVYQLALTMPGLIAARDYVAEDGERVAIVEFDSADNLRNWRQHPDHLRAQEEGRARFYASYRIQICVVERSAEFDAASDSWQRSPY